MTIEEEKIYISELEADLDYHQHEIDRIKKLLVEMKRPKFVDAKQILADLQRRESRWRAEPKPKPAPKPAKPTKSKKSFFDEIDGL
jgi:hypothetical protein